MDTPTASVDLPALHRDLQQRLAEASERLKVPGVAVGIYADGAEDYAFHGVTSVENPLEVNGKTFFQIGSTGKTYTATVIMILVERGIVDLNAPVRRYIPELRLKDASVAERVTVLQLLNHTSGWAGDVHRDTGNGDDALARFVDEVLPTIEQVHPLGEVTSYNNAALNVAGRVIEKVTSMTYEAAVQELLLDPLGLDESFFFLRDIITRRFAVGHVEKDGVPQVARPWGDSRNSNPAGGLSSTAADQIAYARFHLGDGRGKDGTRILSTETLQRMREPTAPYGDRHVGISWMLEHVGGVWFVEHGGSTSGQQSAFRMVPERDFAITVLTNAFAGLQLHFELVEWAMEAYLGVVRPQEEPLPLGPDELAEFAGAYDGAVWIATLAVEGDYLRWTTTFTELGLQEMRESGEDPPQFTPARMKILPRDRFLILDGEYGGLTGSFIRKDGTIQAIDLGRVAPRLPAEEASGRRGGTI
jgi:CubicO group peptidase (beta-lactamase class C family)